MNPSQQPWYEGDTPVHHRLLNYQGSTAELHPDSTFLFWIISFFTYVITGICGFGSGMHAGLIFLALYTLAAGSSDHFREYDIKYAIFLQSLSIICVIPVMLMLPSKKKRKKVGYFLLIVGMVSALAGALLGVYTNEIAAPAAIYVLIGLEMVVISIRDTLSNFLVGKPKEYIDSLAEKGVFLDLMNTDASYKDDLIKKMKERTKSVNKDEKNDAAAQKDGEDKPNSKAELEPIEEQKEEESLQSEEEEKQNDRDNKMVSISILENGEDSTRNDYDWEPSQSEPQTNRPTGATNNNDSPSSHKMTFSKFASTANYLSSQTARIVKPEDVPHRNPLLLTIFLSFFSAYYAGLTGVRSLPIVTLFLRAIAYKRIINTPLEACRVANDTVVSCVIAIFRFVWYLGRTFPRPKDDTTPSTEGYFVKKHYPIYVGVILGALVGSIVGDALRDKVDGKFVRLFIVSSFLLTGFMNFTLAANV